MKLLVSCVALAALGADWRQFRGHESRSLAEEKSLPTQWNPTTNVAWRAELPGRGPSSPIVVDGRVIVTCSAGNHQDRLHVIAVDTESGQRLWHRQFWATGRTQCHPTSANAAPTPTSDGKFIYALFSSCDLICLDLDGNLMWYRGLNLDYPDAGNEVGMASSPQVSNGMVVVQLESQSESFAAGIDTESGSTRWQIQRPRQSNWSSPVVYRDTRLNCDILLLQSPSGLTAHDPQTGHPLWQYDAPCDTISSPLADGETVYVPSGGITALRPDEARQSPGAKVLWKENRLSPGAASPVVAGGNIYTVNSSGVLVCGSATTGEVLWRLRLKGRFWATPVAVGDRLYLVNSDGVAQVVQLGEKGQMIGESDFGEPIQCSPAIAGGALFIRSDGHLWKIAEN